MAAKTIELKAGTVTIENKSKKPQNINIYVPNKENMPCTLEAGDKLIVETRSAGETYSYMLQADKDKDIVITLSAGSSDSGTTGGTTGGITGG